MRKHRLEIVSVGSEMQWRMIRNADNKPVAEFRATVSVAQMMLSRANA